MKWRARRHGPLPARRARYKIDDRRRRGNLRVIACGARGHRTRKGDLTLATTALELQPRNSRTLRILTRPDMAPWRPCSTAHQSAVTPRLASDLASRPLGSGIGARVLGIRARGQNDRSGQLGTGARASEYAWTGGALLPVIVDE
jgi:hypothetical protein